MFYFEGEYHLHYQGNPGRPGRWRNTWPHVPASGQIEVGDAAACRKGDRPDKADFSLTPAKSWDFVIRGAYLRKSPAPKSSP